MIDQDKILNLSESLEEIQKIKDKLKKVGMLVAKGATDGERAAAREAEAGLLDKLKTIQAKMAPAARKAYVMPPRSGYSARALVPKEVMIAAIKESYQRCLKLFREIGLGSLAGKMESAGSIAKADTVFKHWLAGNIHDDDHTKAPVILADMVRMWDAFTKQLEAGKKGDNSMFDHADRVLVYGSRINISFRQKGLGWDPV